MTERYTFSSLHDFLFVELGKAILHGNSPRQCRLCGRWFLHEQGDRAMYCERIAPGEENKTCREAGARAVFEKKIQDEDTWKLYKRAYKKYYARYMKGNMSEADFKAWATQAAAWNPEVLIVTSPIRLCPPGTESWRRSGLCSPPAWRTSRTGRVVCNLPSFQKARLCLTSGLFVAGG